MHLDLRALGYEGSYDRVAAFARQWKVDQLERVNSASKSTESLFISLAAVEFRAQTVNWQPHVSANSYSIRRHRNDETPRIHKAMAIRAIFRSSTYEKRDRRVSIYPYCIFLKRECPVWGYE